MTCSQIAREVNEPLIGTAPNYEHYICIEDKQSLWKRGIGKSASQQHYYERYEHLDIFFSILNGLQTKFVRPLLIDQDREQDNHCIFIYSLQDNHYTCHKYTIDSLNSILALFSHHLLQNANNIPDVIRQVLKPAAKKIDAAQFPCNKDNNPRMFVCNHNYYDRCCSRGKAIHEAIIARGIDSWRCSHIGGHRFAATMMSMPDARYYGKIENEDIDALVECMHAHKPFLSDNKYRGLATVPQELQVAEYLAWTHQKKSQCVIDKVWVKNDSVRIYVKRMYSSGEIEYCTLTLKEQTSTQVRFSSCSDADNNKKQKPWKYLTIQTFQKITS
ncbi:sucrase ferredoxin [Candidatus Uabimicrobium sp. HlEnr_7]|uniref:sucrase ferredoxin n=1 Tax=Candidatus Uabimicrobium helgolandensis TaxID=3095367 RepID=UPI003556EBC9